MAGGYAFIERLADLTGFVQLTSFVTTHGTVALVVLALILAGAVGLIVAAFSDVRTRPANVLDRIALGGLMLVGVGLLLSPTYYYHYGGFMAPFVALAGGAVVGRFQARLDDGWQGTTSAHVGPTNGLAQRDPAFDRTHQQHA
jgi:hypothetical protein